MQELKFHIINLMFTLKMINKKTQKLCSEPIKLDREKRKGIMGFYNEVKKRRLNRNGEDGGRRSFHI